VNTPELPRPRDLAAELVDRGDGWHVSPELIGSGPVSDPQPRRYVTRPREVTAMRWEPYIPAARWALLAWLDAADVRYQVHEGGHPADARLRLAPGTALAGAWVIIDDRKVILLTAREFAANYAEATDV
jgi:hypothetical protein